MTRIWNPAIEAEGGVAFAEVDDQAVAQHRQGGWLLASERDEHIERLAAHPSQQRDEDEADGDDGKTTKTHAAGAKASGGKAGQSGSEGS